MLKSLNKLLPLYEKELKTAIGDCETLLDVGCGSNSPIALIDLDLHSTGIDAHKPSIEKSKSKGIHNEYVEGDVINLDKYFDENSFECVLANDLIEHLTKEDGLKLIKQMERIASKKVIIFTPSGFVPQSPYDNNPWQEHKSGWEPKEMQRKGYNVIGINGIKSLRGERAKINKKPEKLWYLVSMLSQYLVRNKPEKAFQMLCIKNL